MGAGIGPLFYAVAVLASGLACVAILQLGSRSRADRRIAAIACALTAMWALAFAALGPARAEVELAEALRNLAWIATVYRMFANDGRDETVRAVRPLAFSLAMVEGLHALLIVAFAGSGQPPPIALATAALLRVLVAIGVLVMLHNLIASAAESSRRLLAWNAGGLALLFGFSLNIGTVAFLTGSVPESLVVSRALVEAIAIAAFAIGFTGTSANLRFRPSRSVAFSLVSLGLIAVYLVAVILLSQLIGGVSGDLARVTQFAFLLAAIGAALLFLPSQRLRGWARVVLLKHLFKHRYDYRSEWIRFTRTISQADGEGSSLSQRAIKSLADITDSDAGLLLLTEGDRSLGFAADWRWPLAYVPGRAVEEELTAILEREQLIVDLDEARGGIEHHGELAHIPPWLLDEPRAWAAVPLLHHDRLIGLVVLTRPPSARRLDWEDFDLLGIAGRQVASHLAERSGQQALEDAARFEEFTRRMAFVMHDIKNLSSQMGLLVRNAERHADKPEFRRDMMMTLRSSTDKLNAMLARLGRYGASRGEAREEIDLVALANELKQRFVRQHPVEVVSTAPCRVIGSREALDQAVSHMVQNAIDASPDDSPVLLAIASDGLRGQFEVIDTGKGMSPDYVRSELFRPFVSSKSGGFGIGACQARELVLAMGGRLDVVSREGIGTRFTISLPSAEATRIAARRTIPESATA